MLTVKEVAARLKISVSGVYALIASGKLSAYGLGAHGGSLRISEPDLEAYLATCRRGPPDPTPPRAPFRKLKHLQL